MQEKGSVKPAEALINPPLHPGGGVPLSGSDHRLWLSDYSKLAMYDANDERWVTTGLPWPVERLNGLVLQAVGDELLGVALLCEQDCADSETAPPVRVVPLRAATTDDGSVAVHEVGKSSDLIEDLANYAIIGITGRSIDLLVLRSKGGFLTTVSFDGVETTSFQRELRGLCRTKNGYVGVERVDASAPDAVAWGPLPDGWKAKAEDAQRVVVGATPDGMTSVAIPDGAKTVLARWTALANACLPSGLALVGPDSAWEYVDGRWTERPSTMRDGVGNERTGAMVELGEGSLYGRAASTSLMRSADGSWSSLPNDPVLARLGDQTLSYSRPAVSNPTDESGQEKNGGN